MPRKKRRWWTRVPIPEDRIAPAERWLREREIVFATTLTKVDGCYVVRLREVRDAVLFKLTWGGSI
jgi:hypothetical protein